MAAVSSRQPLLLGGLRPGLQVDQAADRELMGLSTPATKVWEIPEPKPAFIPAPSKEREPERLPEPAPAKEREKVPA